MKHLFLYFIFVPPWQLPGGYAMTSMSQESNGSTIAGGEQDDCTIVPYLEAALDRKKDKTKRWKGGLLGHKTGEGHAPNSSGSCYICSENMPPAGLAIFYRSQPVHIDCKAAWRRHERLLVPLGQEPLTTTA